MPEATADQINDAAMCDNKWQFKITGGIDFGMPITIFQVTEGGRADKAGIKLGDSIVQLQNQDTTEMPLKEAQQIIDKASDQLQMTVQKFEDEENDKNEEVEIILKSDKEKNKAPVIAKDQPNLPVKQWIPQPERKVWHPVVWQQPPPPVECVNYGNDAPHKRLITNIRRLLTETENQPEERKKHIEHMLLALPTASKSL